MARPRRPDTILYSRGPIVMRLKDLIPSMFHRRLWLLFIGIGAVVALYAGQLWRLTVAQGAENLRLAEENLVRERWTPTVRGRILDRKGRVLARDEPSFDVLVDYSVITEEWAYTQAAREARRENRTRWPEMSRAERDALVRERYLPVFSRQLESLWRELALALGLPREELERRKAEIRADVQRLATTVWERWLAQRREEMARERETSAEDLTLASVARPLAVQTQPHVLARGVSEDIGRQATRIAERYDGVRVEAEGRRAYPYESMDVDLDRRTFPLPLRPIAPVPAGGEAASADGRVKVHVDGVATHILGWMRRVQREDVIGRPRMDPVAQRVDRGCYLPNDMVGGRGIEASFERTLRGDRGLRVRHLEIAEGEPGAEETIPALPGKDLDLCIDIMLQARIHALMEPALGLARAQPWHNNPNRPPDQPAPLPDGTPLFGAAVVLEIDSGEILALVSTPSFTRNTLSESSESIFGDPVATAWVNRAISKPYPPGSIVKPIILSAAVTEGVFSLSRAIECTGHLVPDKPTRYRCWVFKQHNTTHAALLGHDLLASEALAVSCNIFFYTLARDLGFERVVKWYRAFGVGAAPGLGLQDEYPGSIGAVPRGETPGPSHATLMGIGQGPVAWTPLHAADAYTTVARGGLRIVPRLVRSETPRATELRIDPAAIDAALEGLRRSVNEDLGTGHHVRYGDGTSEATFSNREGIEVLGKTGTAEAPDILGVDPESPEGRRILREGDHSWFVVVVGTKGRPKYAIAVVMEYAGSGGRVSGPIVNQIIEALQVEGYL